MAECQAKGHSGRLNLLGPGGIVPYKPQENIKKVTGNRHWAFLNT